MSTTMIPPAHSAADGVPPPEDAPEGRDGECLTKGEAGGVLDELHATFEQMQALSRRAVQLIQDLNGSGQVEAIEGLPLDLSLALEHKFPYVERTAWINTAQVLEHMPSTAALFAANKISWSQVQAIAWKARRLSNDDKAELDRRVQASVDMIDRLSPDELVDAVQQVVTELQGVARAERAEQRSGRDDHVVVQPNLFGGIRFFGDVRDRL